ncbi:MAG: HAMP domain-containing protein, partial [Rhodospirillales bacterium]|nr:HAMP domain-containing protein [Rhodospirillales bacterium]MCW8970841.1 HAMP domain-containing protein [Rhodospirillales bacterium]
MTDERGTDINDGGIGAQLAGLLRSFGAWARQSGLSRKLALVLTVVAVFSGIATLATMTGSGPQGFEPNTVLALLYLDVVLLLTLGSIVARRLFNMWLDRRRGQAGSRLHAKLVVLFSLVAVTPAVMVAIFAALFLNFGIQAWFSDKVKTALEESRAVVMAYQQEHIKTIRADILAMANDLNHDAMNLIREPKRMTFVLDTHSAIRSIPEAMVIDGSGRIFGRSTMSFSLEFDQLPDDVIGKAEAGEVVILHTPGDDRVRAIYRLDRFVDAYLVVGRFIDPQVIDHIRRTQVAVQQFQTLEKSSSSIQITFVMIFGLVALLLLLAAAWVGLMVAGQLSRPISRLISAAEQVTKGDLSVRVPDIPTDDEIGTLSEEFNRMTGQLETQRDGLVAANSELDERRRFTETVLSGVSAGVIGLDAEGLINLPNRSASVLLGIPLETEIGRDLASVIPEMDHLLKT